MKNKHNRVKPAHKEQPEKPLATAPKRRNKPAPAAGSELTTPAAHKNATPPVASSTEEGERIQKVLARGGLASRREIERWMTEGKIQVNGVQVLLGTRLKAGDSLQVNGRMVNWHKYAEQATRVVIYNKPTGEVVTRNDPQGRPIVFKQMPELSNGRWIAVGRLDINTSGLLILTNNGELANRLMHPSTQIEREYAVRLLGDIPESTLEKLKQGIILEDGKAQFNEIRLVGGEGANKWYYVTVTEGRNRLVRRLWESQEAVVSRLIRVRYGPVVLPENLRAKNYYELTAKELTLLFEFVGMAEPKSDAKPVKKTFSRKK